MLPARREPGACRAEMPLPEEDQPWQVPRMHLLLWVALVSSFSCHFLFSRCSLKGTACVRKLELGISSLCSALGTLGSGARPYVPTASTQAHTSMHTHSMHLHSPCAHTLTHIGIPLRLAH